MKMWDHKFVMIYSRDNSGREGRMEERAQEMLDDHSNDGWELVSHAAHDYYHVGMHDTRIMWSFAFKRPRENG
ncbi:hypothetical protein ABZX93_27380 [Streptomyces sp. NPDC006632]|uniref:hypothetical protein n=1 Tax=unclassified Streptomyces TaxID=2593676 RepID=UPI002E1FF343